MCVQQLRNDPLEASKTQDSAWADILNSNVQVRAWIRAWRRTRLSLRMKGIVLSTLSGLSQSARGRLKEHTLVNRVLSDFYLYSEIFPIKLLFFHIFQGDLTDVSDKTETPSTTSDHQYESGR